MCILIQNFRVKNMYLPPPYMGLGPYLGVLRRQPEDPALLEHYFQLVQYQLVPL